MVTVLFADLVGFTTFSESRDPEHVKNLVDNCFERLAADVTAFGGRVDKVIGDALVALFGAPIAHEDDAERAVRAGLQMQRSVAAYATDVGLNVQLRVGVNTGEVLVGALRAGGDYTAMGDVVNVASRLQTLAIAGGIVVGPETHAATRDVVTYESLGAIQAKGREEPVNAWTAVATLAPPGRRPRRSRTRSSAATPNSACCATRSPPRSPATAPASSCCSARPASARAGWPRRSRPSRWTNTARPLLEGRCIPYGEANVWWPVAEALRQAAEIDADDSVDVTLEKCRTMVADVTNLAGDDEEVGRLAGGLLHLMGHENALQGHRSVARAARGAPRRCRPSSRAWPAGGHSSSCCPSSTGPTT